MAAQPPSPTWVGEQFISKYYDVLAKLPKHLHRFYKENSTFSVADVQPDGHAVVGTATGTLEDIQEKVMSTVANAVVDSDMSLDAQFSQGSGVLLQVSGTMTLQGVHRKFVQVFFLATQEKGYYVLNDMLRIFPPELARDTRPVENGFVGQPAIPAPPFGLAPPQLPGQLPPHVELPPALAPSAPVPPPAVPVQQLPSEAEAVGLEKPAAAAAPAPPPAPASPPPGADAAPASASMVPSAGPAAVAPAVVLTAQQAAAPAQPTQTAPPAPKQVTAPHAAPGAPAAGPPAAPAAMAAPPANLTWAARAALAPSAASASKPVTPAKATSPPAPVLALEVPAVEGSAAPAVAPAVADVDADVPPEPMDIDARAADMLPEPVAGGAEGHPGFGVYVQGIPQTGDIQKLLMTEFAQFGPFGPSGVNVIRSPRYGMVAYIFYQDEKSRDAAREANGKLRLPDSDKPVKILGMLPEFERGFAPRGGGRGERGRGSGMGSGYRSGRGGFDGSRGRGGRGEGGRGDRPMGGPGGRGGRGGDRGGRGGGQGRGPRDASSGPAGPKQG